MACMKYAILTLILFSASMSAAQEAAEPDYELALDAVQDGEILPLADLLADLKKTHPGEVVEVELEYDFGTRVYEIELITPEGVLIEVDLDAATGKILEVEEDD